MGEQKYKVLTIWEPWASLVVHGIKKLETRPKPTKWVGESKDIFDNKTKMVYLIHAAKTFNESLREIMFSEPFHSELEKLGLTLVNDRGIDAIKFSLGHIIGSVEVEVCGRMFHNPDKFKDYIRENVEYYLRIKDIQEPEKSFGDYKPGRYGWILKNPRVLKTPIPYKGGQGYYQNFKGDINKLKFE